MRRLVGVVRALFWASAALMAAWVVLSWVSQGVRDEESFLYLGAALLVLGMASSAFLLWQELRASRQELRVIRRQSRNIRVEDDGGEWSAKAWLYATAFGLSFFVSWYLLPALFLS
jgi:ABC-type nickel/cobalt efflux system permease component RcnA